MSISMIFLLLAKYGVSRDRGFLLDQDPVLKLPEAFAVWDGLAAELPQLCAARAVQRLATDMVDVPVDGLDLAQLERANLVLSFIAHAYVHYSDGVQSLPAVIAKPWRSVTDKLGRPPVLTYYSYNCCNWRRLTDGPIELGNIGRLCNFLGGQDEEWFSMVHVAIEARAGRALAACVDAHSAAAIADVEGVRTALETLQVAVRGFCETLQRMDEGADPYVYHKRVRQPMAGWTLRYEDRGSIETYDGETGAQSSVIPAIDAALGLRCDDLGGDANAATLVPYLLRMRDYMPPAHARLIADLEAPGQHLRNFCAQHPALVDAFDAAVRALADFRALHLGLAFRFVRQWDDRSDDDVLGTGGTAFMPYLRAHRDATYRHALNPRSSTPP